MAKQILQLLLIISVLSLQGCSVIEGIFKAGMWVGILAVIFVIGLILWIFSRVKK
jgi:hypothetical protein